MTDETIDLHAVLPRSRANGPGERFVVWFQGCRLACPGCFNPETHSPEPRHQVPVRDLTARIEGELPQIEGVTVSGGEPFEQPQALLALARRLRARTSLSLVVFTGFTLPELLRRELGRDILPFLDVLVAGRYDRSRHLADGLRGSANQQIHCLTQRYRSEDFEGLATTEVVIGPDGSIVVTGLSPPVLGLPKQSLDSGD